MVRDSGESLLIREGYHQCPECGHEFFCDKRQVGKGRVGRPVQIGANHHSIMSVFSSSPEDWFTNRDVQYVLSDARPIKHVGRRPGWSIAAVQDLVSDLVGRNYLSMRKAERGAQCLYRYEKMLDPEFNGMLL